MSLSDRERAEGFHRSPEVAVTTTAGEWVEGFQQVRVRAVV